MNVERAEGLKRDVCMSDHLGIISVFNNFFLIYPEVDVVLPTGRNLLTNIGNNLNWGRRLEFTGLQVFISLDLKCFSYAF